MTLVKQQVLLLSINLSKCIPYIYICRAFSQISTSTVLFFLICFCNLKIWCMSRLLISFCLFCLFDLCCSRKRSATTGPTTTTSGWSSDTDATTTTRCGPLQPPGAAFSESTKRQQYSSVPATGADRPPCRTLRIRSTSSTSRSDAGASELRR